MVKLATISLALAYGVASVSADLRMASQPRNAFQVAQRNAVQFTSKTALYMEPSDFQYAGLKQQRDGGAYDNFLRSNIDNEQDKRNFATEPGRDMLPFRSLEAAPTDADASVKNKMPDGAPGPAITATPGVPYVVPLRWNNPHASELEVNIWLTKNNNIVVPIRKPTCSGEGHQDNVFSFTVPSDFNQLGSKIVGFTGCKQEGDCVLQIYAHSVESRTYAIGTPLIVTGAVPAATATVNQVAPASVEVGTDLTKLPNDVCLSSADPSADITVSLPRQARLVSDVYNHAYQNSNYSPYSGQQPEAISKNLQASAILRMVTGNRGELGRALLKAENPAAAALQQQLETKQANLVKQYEAIVNKIIQQIGDKSLKDTATVATAAASNAPGGQQKLANCFRCAEVGSTTTTRLQTNTYVPSFQLPANLVAQAKALVPAQYSQLISPSGVVQIYVATLNDMSAQFAKAATLGLTYQPAMIKTTATTMADATKFIKVDANGKPDKGIYAAKQAKIAAAKAAAATATKVAPTPTVLQATLESNNPVYPDTAATPIDDERDMDALNFDSSCDDDQAIAADPNMTCSVPKQMFAASVPDDTATSFAHNLQAQWFVLCIAFLGAIFFQLF